MSVSYTHLDVYKRQVVGDNQQYAQLMREYKHMQPIIEKYHEYLQAQNDFTEAREILDGEEDAELREMAQAELEQSKDCLLYTSRCV